mmetsp:Transcript_42022/g.99617  ORF Transcript_42022/g.99617 Transcript_42022/m.99617 type:complete len:329 (-) Transcript_42022:90-1076(-)
MTNTTTSTQDVTAKIANEVNIGATHNSTLQEIRQIYDFGEPIGIGGYAIVRRATHRISRQTVAIKVVDRSRYAIGDNSLEHEIQVLCKVDHPNCVKLYDVYYTVKSVYLVMELLTGGELLERVSEKGNLSEAETAKLVQQILRGVQYLHSQGIVHRDLKLENIILADNQAGSVVKIADFGLSRLLEPTTLLQTLCGSPQYVAPEVLAVGDTINEYTPAVDMWSVGVILFMLLSGYSPFDDDNVEALYGKIRSGKYDADDPVWDGISDLAKDLVARLLTVDASHRLSAFEALQHPWMRLALGGPGSIPMDADPGMHSGLAFDGKRGAGC